MKNYSDGDTVWCWDRSDDNMKIDGFKARCINPNKESSVLQVITDCGIVENVNICDVEPYNEYVDHHENKLIMSAFKKFKNLPHEKKKEMLQKIGLIESKTRGSEPLPDPYSMPDENEYNKNYVSTLR